QNYMNNRLGYNLQFWQYLQFMDTCAAHAADTVTSTNCTPVTIAQTFTSGGADNMINIANTPDGGYALAGYKTINGVWNAYLMRYNSTGAVQWAKTYSAPGGSQFWQVRATSDGGFVATGHAFSDNTQGSGSVLVVKTDGAGTAQWVKTYGFPTNPDDGYGSKSFDIIQTSDGGYAVVGDYGLSRDNTGSAQMLCMKLGPNGEFKWAREMDHGNNGDGYGVAES